MNQKNCLTNLLMQQVFVAVIFLLPAIAVNAQEANKPAEKKVDYLERIYFSGESKEGLNTQILITLQEIQQKLPTDALAKQVTFLLDVKDNAEEAKSACDILDLLAVGIYNIDAAEAARQGVHMPSDKAKEKSANALASLNKLNSSSNNLSTTAGNLAWDSYLLSGGKYGNFAAGAGKVARTAGNIGTVAGTAKDLGKMGKDVVDLGKSFGIKIENKKACKDVEKKEIEIGEHVAPNAFMFANEKSNANTNAASTPVLTTVVNLSGVTSASLRTITDTLRTKPGVQSAEKVFSDNLSTITVMHSGSLDALADWLEDKFGTKFKLANYGNGVINLVAKK